MEKPQTWLACINGNTSTPPSEQMCFFIGYFCLLIITTKAIIKANVMIVTDTRPANNNFIINFFSDSNFILLQL